MSNNKIKTLTERQKAVIETMKMRLTEKEAIQYLSDYGFEMSDTTWYREKNKLEKMKLERLYHIAKHRFDEQHLERVDTCETIQKMMWRNFNDEKDPYKRNQILKDILSLQSYLSAYYEATIDVMKESVYMKRYYNPEFEKLRDDEINPNSTNKTYGKWPSLQNSNDYKNRILF